MDDLGVSPHSLYIQDGVEDCEDSQLCEDGNNSSEHGRANAERTYIQGPQSRRGGSMYAPCCACLETSAHSHSGYTNLSGRYTAGAEPRAPLTPHFSIGGVEPLYADY